MPKQLDNLAEFEKAVADSEGKTIIIDIGAEWCGPCQLLAPIYIDLEKEFASTTFYKVENDGDGEEIVDKYEIEHMPTILIYKDQNEVERLFGTKKLTEEVLRQKLQEHQSLPAVQAKAKEPAVELSQPPVKSIQPQVNGASSRPALQVKRLDKNAKLPLLGSVNAAGYDLHALTDAIVPKRGKELIPTGLAFAIPVGNYGRIAPRSGLAVKHSIDVGAGVIDADYRGEVKVILFNQQDDDFEIKAGDRIAQMIIEKYTPTDLVEVQDLDDTVRGDGGFGSTGVKEEFKGEKRGLQELKQITNQKQEEEKE